MFLRKDRRHCLVYTLYLQTTYCVLKHQVLHMSVAACAYDQELCSSELAVARYRDFLHENLYTGDCATQGPHLTYKHAAMEVPWNCGLNLE
jgi:hypothetical protein